jgi:type I restriction enzyme S subunit
MPTTTTGFKQTEVGPIPEDWEVVSVEEISAKHPHALATGPFGSSISSKYFKNSGIPVIRGGNMSAETTSRLIDDDLVFLSLEKAAEFRRSTVRDGDLIFTCWGTINQVGLIDETTRYSEYVISNKQMKLTPDSNRADSLFLYYSFLGPELQDRIELQSIGSSVPGFNLGQLRSIRLKLPPLAEQRAIADALADVDALLDRLDALVAKKRAVKTATMQRLLTGRQRLPGFSGAWETKRFGEIVSQRSDRVMPNHSNSGHFCIELEHIEQGTGSLNGETKTSPSSSLKAVFEKDDVLFAKLRPYLRKYWLADRSGVCSTEIWVLQAKPDIVSPSFLYHHVTLDRFVIVASQAHGTHMPRADWKVVRNYEVDLPPLEEQRAIAAVLSAMDAEIEAVRARRAKTQAVKRGMMQELLTGRTRLV